MWECGGIKKLISPTWGGAAGYHHPEWRLCARLFFLLLLLSHTRCILSYTCSLLILLVSFSSALQTSTILLFCFAMCKRGANHHSAHNQNSSATSTSTLAGGVGGYHHHCFGEEAEWRPPCCMPLVLLLPEIASMCKTAKKKNQVRSARTGSACFSSRTPRQFSYHSNTSFSLQLYSMRPKQQPPRACAGHGQATTEHT